MRFHPKNLTAVCGSLGLVLSIGAQAQQSAPAPQHDSIKASCAASDGKSAAENAKSKAECEKVAAKMEQSAARAETSTESRPQSDPSYVQHSSPIMQTDEEKAAAKAIQKGQDPAAAVAKVKQRNSKLAAEKNKSEKRP